MRYLLCFCFLALMRCSSEAQIVNIETQRIQSDTTGWLGNIGSSFSFEKNVIEVLHISTLVHVEYKTKRSLYLFLVNYDFLRGSDQTLDNNLFYHLRYNYKLSKVLRWEAFTQLQNNKITGIRSRFLLGSGPRFKIAGSQQFSLYASTAAMYEYEKEQTLPVIIRKALRSSSYITASFKPSAAVELIGTIFYQPLFKDFSDYRILNEISLKIKIAKHFTIETGWQYLYDSNPVPSIPSISYRISNGIVYLF